MGLCHGGEMMTPEERDRLRAEKKRSQELQKKMKDDFTRELHVNKLLLLGAGESGKSTLFKQMISIHGRGFSDEDRAGYKGIIHGNIVTSLKKLAEQSEVLSEKFEETRCQDEIEGIRKWLLGIPNDIELKVELAHRIDAFWKSAAIQETYTRRSLYQLTDSTKYYLDDIFRVTQPEYLPTEADVLRSRVRTTGIVENHFIIENNDFKMFDVGGQRNERKKWIHCFEDVTAVLFVAALSEYDLRLFEDETVNRMHEAVQLFGEICNSPWFKKTSMILLLNKSDLFMEKIEAGVEITSAYPEYDGPHNFEACSEYIRLKFEDENRSGGEVYTHITNATDRSNVAFVFNAVKDIVIRRSLQEGGLLVS